MSIINQFRVEDLAKANRNGVPESERQPTWMPIYWTVERFKFAVRELFPNWTKPPSKEVSCDRDFYTSKDGFNSAEDKWTRQQWLSLIDDALLSEKRQEQTKFNSHLPAVEKRRRGRSPNADSPWTRESNINALASEVAERMEKKIAAGQMVKVRSEVVEAMLASIARDNGPGRRNKPVDGRRLTGLVDGVYDRVRKNPLIKIAKAKKKRTKNSSE